MIVDSMFGKTGKLSCIASTLSVCMAAGPAYAWEFDYSGFLTIGMGQLNHDRVKYIDYDNQLSFNSDSLLGLQLDLDIYDRLSFTTQLVSRGYSITEDHSDYEPEINWAYGTFQISPSLKVRAGRLVTPQYMVSDYQDVGYAYQWVRPPLDVYTIRAEPFNQYDGVELVYNGKFYGMDSIFQVLYGNYEDKTEDVNVEVDKVVGFNVTVGTESFSLRYAYLHNEVTLTVPRLEPLIEGFDQAGDSVSFIYPGFSDAERAAATAAYKSVASMYVVSDEPFVYQSFGGHYEWDNWLFQSEMTSVDSSDQFATDAKSIYFSISYQFENFTPYIYISKYRNDTSTEIRDNINAIRDFTPDDLQPPLDGLYDLLDGGILTVEASNLLQHSIAIGTRYDFYENMALKFEVLRVIPERVVGGQLFNDGLSEGEKYPKINVFSMTFDYIF